MLLYIGLGFIVAAVLLVIVDVMRVRHQSGDGKNIIDIFVEGGIIAICATTLLSVGVVLLVVAGIKALV